MEQIFEYAESAGCGKEVTEWLNTTGRKALIKTQKTTHGELEHIIDWFVNGDDVPKRLLKMSIEDAKRKADAWSERRQKKGRNLRDIEGEDIETLLQFDDGSRIVKLKTKRAFEREGYLMSHCLGGYNPGSEGVEICSYRDSKNNPHATFEVREQEGEVLQIKGKGNGHIHPNYVEPVVSFLEHIGMEVRTSEMRNLGYYHVPHDLKEKLKNYPQMLSQVVGFRGSEYAIRR